MSTGRPFWRDRRVLYARHAEHEIVDDRLACAMVFASPRTLGIPKLDAACNMIVCCNLDVPGIAGTPQGSVVVMTDAEWSRVLLKTLVNPI